MPMSGAMRRKSEKSEKSSQGSSQRGGKLKFNWIDESIFIAISQSGGNVYMAIWPSSSHLIHSYHPFVPSIL